MNPALVGTRIDPNAVSPLLESHILWSYNFKGRIVNMGDLDEGKHTVVHKHATLQGTGQMVVAGERHRRRTRSATVGP